MPLTRHSPPREPRLVEGLLRRIRFSARQSPTRSGITAETMQGSSGREMASTTSHSMANPWRTFRNLHRAMSITLINMMFPGIGPIDIRRLSRLLTDPMCRAAPRRTSRFPDMAAKSKPSASRGATDERVQEMGRRLRKPSKHLDQVVGDPLRDARLQQVPH